MDIENIMTATPAPLTIGTERNNIARRIELANLTEWSCEQALENLQLRLLNSQEQLNKYRDKVLAATREIVQATVNNVLFNLSGTWQSCVDKCKTFEIDAYAVQVLTSISKSVEITISRINNLSSLRKVYDYLDSTIEIILEHIETKNPIPTNSTKIIKLKKTASEFFLL
jgi:hypothetical protein